ncbi:unnamed protein product, partial [Amoebophrya sp. A120]
MEREKVRSLIRRRRGTAIKIAVSSFLVVKISRCKLSILVSLSHAHGRPDGGIRLSRRKGKFKDRKQGLWTGKGIFCVGPLCGLRTTRRRSGT